MSRFARTMCPLLDPEYLGLSMSTPWRTIRVEIRQEDMVARRRLSTCLSQTPYWPFRRRMAVISIADVMVDMHDGYLPPARIDPGRLKSMKGPSSSRLVMGPKSLNARLPSGSKIRGWPQRYFEAAFQLREIPSIIEEDIARACRCSKGEAPSAAGAGAFADFVDGRACPRDAISAFPAPSPGGMSRHSFRAFGINDRVGHGLHCLYAACSSFRIWTGLVGNLERG